MPKSSSLIVPIGSNMTDAAYPFRGVYKVKDTLSHGHGGAPGNGRSVSNGFAHSTSLTLKITGNNLRIEEMHVPPSQALNCELSIDNSAPRKINLNHNNENLCLSVPSDGHTYNLTSIIKRINSNSNNVSNSESQNAVNGITYNASNINNNNNNNNNSRWSATGCRGASKHFCHLILQSNAQNDDNNGTPRESSRQVNTTQKPPIDANTNMLFIPVRIINSTNSREHDTADDNEARFRFIVDGHVIEPLNGCYYLPTNAQECLLDVFPQTSALKAGNLTKPELTNQLIEPEMLSNAKSTVPWSSSADSVERPHYITVKTLYDQVDKGNTNSNTFQSGKAVLECPVLSSPAMSLNTPSSKAAGEIIELSSESPSLIPVHHGLYKLHLPARSEPESTITQTPAELAANKSDNEEVASLNLPERRTHNTYPTTCDTVPDIETKWEELDDGTRAFVANAAGFLITLTTTIMTGAITAPLLIPEVKSITGMNSVRLIMPTITQDHASKEFIPNLSSSSSSSTEQRITMTLADIYGNIKLRQTHYLPLQINKTISDTNRAQETTPSTLNPTNVPIASPPHSLSHSLSVPVSVPPVIPLPVTLPGVQNVQSSPSSPSVPQSIALRWEEVPMATNASVRTAMLPQPTSHSLVRLYGNDGTWLSCNYKGNSSINDINRVKGADGLLIDRSQYSHITIEHVAGLAANTSMTLDLSPALPSEQSSTQGEKISDTKVIPTWVASLAQALQSRTAEEAKRQVEAIDMSNDVYAACIVGFVKDQLCRSLPSLSFAVERSGISSVSCPGYTIVAEKQGANGNDLLDFVPADAQGNVAFTVKTHPHGRSLSTCQVHLPSYAEESLQINQKSLTQEEVLDSQLVSALVKTLQPSYSLNNVDLLIEEIKRLASLLLSHNGSLLIDSLQRTLQRVSIPAQSESSSTTTIVNESSNQEIFVTCNYADRLEFTNIHTRHPEYIITASILPSSTNNIDFRKGKDVICQDDETNNMQIIPQHGSFMPPYHLIKKTTLATTESSLPSKRTVHFTARNPVTQQIVSQLQIQVADAQCTRDGNAVQSRVAAETAATIMPRGKSSSLKREETSTPYVDVYLKESGNNKMQVRLLTPVGMRLIYTIDGESAMSGSVDVHIELNAERAHHIELSLMNTDDQVVFQQKLNIPPHAIPSYGLTLTEHGLLIDPDKEFDVTYSIDKRTVVDKNNESNNNNYYTITRESTAETQQEEMYMFHTVTNNLIAMDNNTGHYVVLRKNERKSNTCNGNEVRLRIPQWLSYDVITVLANMAQMLTLEKEVWHTAIEKLNAFCKDDTNALPLRTLASVLLHLVNIIQNLNANNNRNNKSVKQVNDNTSETILQPGVRLLQRAPENELSRVYFRLTGVD